MTVKWLSVLFIYLEIFPSFLTSSGKVHPEECSDTNFVAVQLLNAAKICKATISLLKIGIVKGTFALYFTLCATVNFQNAKNDCLNVKRVPMQILQNFETHQFYYAY